MAYKATFAVFNVSKLFAESFYAERKTPKTK